MDQKEPKTLIRNLTTGSVSKQLFTFSMLLLMSGLLQMAYNMADMVIVGQYVGALLGIHGSNFGLDEYAGGNPGLCA